MSPDGPRGLVALLLRIAVRRWPAALRDEQCHEWTGELAALRGQPRSGWRRLRFVASLAVAVAPEEGGIVRDWRETLPGVGRRLLPAFGFFLVGLLATLFGSFSAESALAEPVVALVGAGVGLVAGWRSRLPMPGGRTSRSRWWAAVGLAGMATTAAALGHASYRLIAMANVMGWAQLEEYEVVRTLVASIAFVVLLAPVLAIGIGLAAAERRLIAIPVAVAGLGAALVVADHADIWPYVRRRIEGPFGPELGTYEYTYGLFNPLVLLSVYAVAYGIGIGRRGSTAEFADPVAGELKT